MISLFDQPHKEIEPEELFGYGSRHLILRAARKKGIDCQILFRTKRSRKQTLYVRLTKGKKHRWISPPRGFFNSKLSCELALHKDLTHQVLQSNNLPVPRFAKINQAKQIDQIEIPAPWVIKPANQTRGKNVIVKIKTRKKLKRVASQLLKKYRYLIVEQFIRGSDFRLLMLENKLLGAVERIPPRIKGDGKQTIKQLIEMANKKERKREAKSFGPFLKKIKVDLEVKRCLASQGLKFSSIPKKDQLVRVRQNANFSTGGATKDVTKQVHPDNIKIARRAIKALGLQFGGVDIITKDISRPITKNKGKIIEINGIPAIWIHHFPNQGKGRNIASQLVDYLFREKI